MNFPSVNTHSCCKRNIRDAFQNVLQQSRRLSGFENQAENCKLRLFISLARYINNFVNFQISLLNFTSDNNVGPIDTLVENIEQGLILQNLFC